MCSLKRVMTLQLQVVHKVQATCGKTYQASPTDYVPLKRKSDLDYQ